jgi:alginate O-acetyltransferase complex protein AlgI
MLFQSSGFLFLFLPLFLIIMLILPKRTPRTICILIFSYLFYSGNEPFFVLILLFSSIVDYFVALRVANTQHASIRKAWLIVSITINLGLFSFYKYGPIFLPQMGSLCELLGLPSLLSPGFYKSFVLPAGISFYTFQSMSYTIDVYRNELKPEKNLLGYLNYVAYLPQLIAGPIERFKNLYPQLQALASGDTRFTWTPGLDRIALGIIEKLLIADSCGHIVDTLLQNGGPYTLFSAWAIAIGFGMQIFFDFAAYSHMAIGISLVLGVRLSENFLSPYQSSDIQQFWRRWHVSLSSWFRDYLYIPIGGSKGGQVKTFLNLLFTFMLVGLWHGAGWNYIAWGVAHGLLMGGFRVYKHILPNVTMPKLIGVGLTFIVVQIIWVLFRVNDIIVVSNVWKGMLGLNGWGLGRTSIPDIVFLVFLSVLTLVIPNAAQRWPGSSGWVETTLIWGLAVFALINSPQINQFIYFQF